MILFLMSVLCHARAWSCSALMLCDGSMVILTKLHVHCNRLQDVVHSEKRLYLVFEYLDLDLKKHMDTCPDLAKDPRLIKVG